MLVAKGQATGSRRRVRRARSGFTSYIIITLFLCATISHVGESGNARGVIDARGMREARF